MKKTSNRALKAVLPVLLAVTACTAGSPELSGTRGTLLHISAGTAVGADVTTRADAGGTSAFSGSMGLFVCRHEPDTPTQFVEQNPLCNNISASGSGSGFSFRYEGSDAAFSNLYLTSNREGTNADVYAYAPYTAGVTAPTSVPFATTSDIMWAEQNAGPRSGGNMDIAIDGSDKPVTLTFHHLLARIRVGFRLHHAGSHLAMSCTITHPAGQTPLTQFYNGGKMNAMNGTLFDKTECETLSLYSADSGNNLYQTVTLASADSYTYMYALTVPTPILDNLQLNIYVGGLLFGTYTLTPEMFLHSDGTTQGLQGGYTYTFQFDIDNYTHLTGLHVDDSWTDGSGIDLLI